MIRSATIAVSCFSTNIPEAFLFVLRRTTADSVIFRLHNLDSFCPVIVSP